MNELETWNDDPEEHIVVRRQPTKDIFHETVYAMWEGGVRDLEEIRMETGYTTAYIRTLLNSRGLEVSTVKARSPEEIANICADYQNPNIRVRQVLRKWALSLNTLYTILDDAGVPLRKSVSPKKGQNMEQAIQMYVDGTPVKIIQNETGIDPSSLYKEIDVRGVVLRSSSAVNDEIVKLAVELYKSSDLTVPQIQEQTGVPMSRLYREVGVQKLSRRQRGDTEKAVELYLSNHSTQQIQDATGVSVNALYKELSARNIPLRRGRAQGEPDKAILLYEQGARAEEIRKVTSVSVPEMVHLLRKRGGMLRTGLPTIVTPKNLDYAVDEYTHNVDVETIEIDTLVTRTQLYSALRKKGIAIRP